jgi:uncharacterized protein YndB with AHSA1/START domain
MSIQRSYTIPAKPAPVFDALTSELHLRTWFAEQLEVGGAPGAPFRFWGKHTLWVPEASDATQTLTRLDFPSALAFSWTWRGAPTQVSIEVAEDGEGTRLELRHAFERPWPANDPDLGEVRAARQDRIVEAFWDVAMANLVYYLFEGEPLLLPDYEATSEQVELSLAIEAPVEEGSSSRMRARTAMAGLPRMVRRWGRRGYSTSARMSVSTTTGPGPGKPPPSCDGSWRMRGSRRASRSPTQASSERTLCTR